MPRVIFCEECENLLYPRVHPGHSTLEYVCLKCHEESDKTESCVFRHQIAHIPNEENLNVPYLATDPSLPRNVGENCPSCDTSEPVHFQSSSKHKETKMTLYFVCSNLVCGHKWARGKDSNKNEYLQARV